MARESRVTREWRERAQAAELSLTLAERVIGAMRQGEMPEAIARDEQGNEYQLWHSARPEGGTLVRIHTYRGQNPEVRIGTLDAELVLMSPFWRADVREALNHLRNARERITSGAAA